MSHVYVGVYTSKWGQTIRVFETMEKSTNWYKDCAEQYWADSGETKPMSHYTKVKGEYFKFELLQREVE